MHHTKIAAACAWVALLSAGAARADDSGFYLGASVGEATQSGLGFDGRDTAFRWHVGYSINEYLAAEAGFVDGGKQKDTVGGVNFAVSSNGTFAAILARLPLGKVIAPYAKLGYVVYESTTTASNGSMVRSESRSDEDLSYGGGLEFRLGEHFRLRADYEKVDVPDVAFDIYSVVATWQF